MTKSELPPWTFSWWSFHATHCNFPESKGLIFFHLHVPSIRKIATCVATLRRRNMLRDSFQNPLLIMRLCLQDGFLSSSYILIAASDFPSGPELIESVCLALSSCSYLSGIWLESHWDLESLWPWGLKFLQRAVWGQFLKAVSLVDLPLLSKPQEFGQRSHGKCESRSWIHPAQ